VSRDTGFGVGEGEGFRFQVAMAAMAASATDDAALQSSACRHLFVAGAAIVSSALTEAASVSSISMRASPASRARLLISFCKQRRNNARILNGVVSGSACQSGSHLSTAARISVVVSP
jgi:hypothetical protein